MATEFKTTPLTQFNPNGTPRHMVAVVEGGIGDGERKSYRYGDWGYRAFPDTPQQEPAVNVRLEDYMNSASEPHSMVSIDGVNQRLTAGKIGVDQITQLYGKKAGRQVKEIYVYKGN